MYTTPDTACCKPIIPRFLKKTRNFDRQNRPQKGREGFGKESLQLFMFFGDIRGNKKLHDTHFPLAVNQIRQTAPRQDLHHP